MPIQTAKLSCKGSASASKIGQILLFPNASLTSRPAAILGFTLKCQINRGSEMVLKFN